MNLFFSKLRSIFSILAILILGLANTGPVSASPAAVPAGYFSSQTFSTFTNATQGEVCGNSFSIIASGSFGTAPKISVYSPGSAPAGSGMPASLSMLEWGSVGTSGVVTITFTTPLTPADHIFLEDLDFNEQVKLAFYDAANALINPSSFILNPVSTTGAPTISQSATEITFTSPTPGIGQNEPFGEVMESGSVNPVKKIVYTGTGAAAAGSTIETYFSCSQLSLADAFSPTFIQQDGTSTLKFTISQVNGNPLYHSGIIDNLPAGLQVAQAPNISNNCSNGSSLVAVPAATSLTFSGLSLAYNNTFGPSCSFSVDVTNRSGLTNTTCSGNPPEFTNGTSNLVGSSFNLSSIVISPACLVVNYKLPLISSFTPGSAGTGHQVIISGAHFNGATAVSFGGVAAKSFIVDSDTQFTAVVGAGASGQVSVTTPGGTANSIDLLTYLNHSLFMPTLHK